MEFLQQHWAIVVANPWLFATWTTAVASATWIVIHFLYQHRIELYKHRTDEDAAEIQRLRIRIGETNEASLSKTDAPSLVSASEVSAHFDFGSANLHLGGEGGRAPGSGGGGGGAIGSGARAGRGGDGGRTTDLDGNPLPPSALAHLLARLSMDPPPGAGGAGAGAMGPGAIAGDGGNGGDGFSWAIPVEPGDQFQIEVGEGGQSGRLPGQHGSAGGDIVLTHRSSDGELKRVLRARGGAAASSGALPDDWFPISQGDIEDGCFQISTLFAASSVDIREGLMFVLAGGWSKFSVPAFPFDVVWPVVCVATWKRLSEGHSRGLQICLSDPDGTEVSRQALELPAISVHEKSHSWVTGLGAHLNTEGAWSIAVRSSGILLAEVAIAVTVAQSAIEPTQTTM